MDVDANKIYTNCFQIDQANCKLQKKLVKPPTKAAHWWSNGCGSKAKIFEQLYTWSTFCGFRIQIIKRENQQKIKCICTWCVNGFTVASYLPHTHSSYPHHQKYYSNKKRFECKEPVFIIILHAENATWKRKVP